MLVGRSVTPEVQTRPARSPRESRRMRLLKRAGLYGQSMEGITILRAVHLDDLREAYRLVHDIFVEEGYILPHPSGLRVRPYEAMPETATFIAKARGRVVGVQGLVLDCPELGLPSDGAFKGEIDPLRGQGRLIGEATNEAVDACFRRSGVTTELMRCCFAHALVAGCTDLITTVSPGHAKFYELLGFERISPVRSYSARVHDPVVVVRLRLDVLEERFAGVSRDDGDEGFLMAYYIEDNPYHRQVRAWSQAAAEAFRDPEMLRELFLAHGGLLEGCCRRELAAIRKRWGEELFERVCAGRLQPAGAG